MAAAIIPIIAAAAPLLTPIIKDLVLNAQKLFGHNQGTGATKAQTVIDAVMTVAEKLSTAGKIPGQVDVASIASMVESVVQQLKAGGILPSDGTTPVAPATTTTATVIAGGQFVRITGTLEVLK